MRRVQSTRRVRDLFHSPVGPTRPASGPPSVPSGVDGRGGDMRRGLVVVLAVLSGLVVSAGLLAVRRSCDVRHARRVLRAVPARRRRAPARTSPGPWRSAGGWSPAAVCTAAPCAPARAAASPSTRTGGPSDWIASYVGADPETTQGPLPTRSSSRRSPTSSWGTADDWPARMGIMYVIWNDRDVRRGGGFEPKKYLSSGCRSRTARSPCGNRDPPCTLFAQHGRRPGLTS